MNAHQSERGVALVEVLVAVAVLGAALIVFLSGISTGTIATARSDRQSTAQELARSQMEYVKALPYTAAPATYPSVPAPSGYGVTADAAAVEHGDASVQLIIVEVLHEGAVIYTLEGLKVER
jgi:Tfp pilus assembly protein PilV